MTGFFEWLGENQTIEETGMSDTRYIYSTKFYKVNRLTK